MRFSRPFESGLKGLNYGSIKMAKVSNIPLGEGKIVEIDGKPVAVFNDNDAIKALSTICPHAGCGVEWNGGEKTWDCPCHGSRFSAAGELLKGPAKTGLEKLGVKIEGDDIKLA